MIVSYLFNKANVTQYETFSSIAHRLRRANKLVLKSISWKMVSIRREKFEVTEDLF